jgi:hypothetical protein
VPSASISNYSGLRRPIVLPTLHVAEALMLVGELWRCQCRAFIRRRQIEENMDENTETYYLYVQSKAKGNITVIENANVSSASYTSDEVVAEA